MKRVHRGSTVTEVAHLQNVLEHAGIRTFLKNENLGGVFGALPFPSSTPELWVLVDADSARASEMIREALAGQPAPGAAPWRCARCGEQNEAQFGACWSCGAADPKN